MNRKLLLCAAVVAATTVLLAPRGFAQERATTTKARENATVQSQEALEKPADLSNPGPAHKLLEKRAGTWKMVYHVYASPRQPPIELPATGELSMIFGGRFLKHEMTGEGPFQGTSGLGVEGYDSFKKRYFFNWVDTNGTRTITLTGTADESGQVMTYTGEIDDAATGTKGIKVRVVVRIASADQHTFEFFQTLPGGKEFKPFDITYRRR